MNTTLTSDRSARNAASGQSRETALLDLSVVIPAYNEQSRLPGTLERCCEYLGGTGMSFEIVVVDDGSRDTTAEVVRSFSERDARVRLVQQDRNRGKGAAIRRGVLEARGELLLLNDADNATPIEEIDRLLRGMTETGADVVVASRAMRTPDTKVERKLHRFASGRIFATLVNLLAVPGVADTQCGFKLLKRRCALDVFDRQKIDGFAFDVEVLFIASALGYRLHEVAVNWADIAGSKVSVLRDSVRMFSDIVVIRRLHPELTQTLTRPRASWLTLLPEMSVTALVAVLYLFVCKTRIFSGDGMVYADQALRGEWVFNPNHLLMNPIAHWALALGRLVGLGIVDALKLVSGAATVFSLILFHALLWRLGVASSVARWAGVGALLFSRNVLSMAISEEFFVVQLPLLLLVGLVLTNWIRGNPPGFLTPLVAGGLVGLAAAISIHNVLLAGGLAAGLLIREWVSRRPGVRPALLLIAATAAALVPLLVAGHHASRTNAPFLKWMTSYQGTSNTASALYGIKPELRSTGLAVLRVPFSLVTNVADSGGFGQTLKAAMAHNFADFVPHYGAALIGGLFWIATGVGLVLLFVRRPESALGARVTVCTLFWCIPYVVFGFVWNNSDDQFWFQVTPVLAASFAAWIEDSNTRRSPSSRRRTIALVCVALLAILNTAFVIAPVSFRDVDGAVEQHAKLLGNDVLEIYPGWDTSAVLLPKAARPGYEKISLLDAALGNDPRIPNLETLSRTVRDRLERGGTVLVARLFERDAELKPWEELRALGWPRTRIVDELSSYQRQQRATLLGMGIWELVAAPASSAEKALPEPTPKNVTTVPPPSAAPLPKSR